MNLFFCFVAGYIPGGEAVEVVGQLAQLIKNERDTDKEHPLIYVLDRECFLVMFFSTSRSKRFSFRFSAVMGDHGILYVAESVIPIYRSLLPLATIITPNQFEAE